MKKFTKIEDEKASQFSSFVNATMSMYNNSLSLVLAFRDLPPKIADVNNASDEEYKAEAIKALNLHTNEMHRTFLLVLTDMGHMVKGMNFAQSTTEIHSRA